MANYNPLTSPRVERNRNGFDLSQNHVFSAKIGQLLPILSIDCVPGDYHEIDVAALSKTMPVRTDAFARVKQNFEFFFVPYEQLWHNWGTFISQRYVKKTSHSLDNTGVPYFKRQELVRDSCRALVNQVKDMHGMNTGANALRLADLLGYGSYQNLVKYEGIDPDGFTDLSNYQLNAFRICAYNKIWYDYYRNKWHDTDKQHIFSFNLDDVGSDNAQSPSRINDNVEYSRIHLDDQRASNIVPNVDISSSTRGTWTTPYSLFQMRYRQYKKDLFTSALPSQQFGLVETLPAGAFHLFQKGIPSGDSTVSIMGTNRGADAGKLGNTYQAPSNLDWYSDISIYAVKKAEAIQHWKETVMRAGEDFRQQMESRYGVRPKFTSLDSVDFIGSCSSDVEINPIYSTAQTDGAPLGEIAGRGQSLTDGKIQYHASDFGVLMCIYSLVPDVSYCASGIDKQNTFADPFDFFTPEIEDLGLEPINTYLLDSIGALNVSDEQIQFGNPSIVNAVRGYSSRYSCYKTAVDKVHGEFIPQYNDLSPAPVGHSVFSSWILDRSDLLGRSVALQQFYISPFVDSNIFGASSEWEYDDHYLVNAFFKINSVREMSVLGLPRW